MLLAHPPPQSSLRGIVADCTDRTAFGSADRASQHPVSEWVIASRLEGAASRAIMTGPYSKVATVAAGIIIATLVFKDTDFALSICRASFLAMAIELLYFWGQRTIRK